MQTQTKKSFLRKFKNFILFFITKKYKFDSKAEPEIPVTISIKNLTDKTFQDVSVFNSKLNDFEIEISSVSKQISFSEIRNQIAVKPLKIAITYLMSKDVLGIKHLDFVSKTIKGIKIITPLVFTVDPYQYQTGISVFKYEYELNNLTDIIIPELRPNKEFLIGLYEAPKIKRDTNFQKFVYWLKK